MKNTKREIATKKVVVSNKKVLLKDQRTGEVEDFGFAEIHAEKIVRNRNFAMLWLSAPDTGLLAVDLLFWLYSVSVQNVVMVSVKFLSKKFGVTRQTICFYLRKFAVSKLLKWGFGVIFLNPEFFFRGSVYGRERAMARYSEFQAAEDSEE